MHNHAPTDYVCPICLGIQGYEDDRTLIRKSDIVFHDEFVMAFISSFFIGKNPGHIVVVPTKHFENIYDLPHTYAHRIFDVAQKMAIALKKAYTCDGVTTLQNNEPAGNQHAFHYHFHVFPRYEQDNLHDHMITKKNSTPEERVPFAEKIRSALAD